jgi:hypothetical protein
MFRTARGFLLVAPPAFLIGLVAFLVLHPRALDSYTVYPVLADVLGAGLVKRPLARFVATALLFFLVPYLVTGLLLFFADLGLAAAMPLWTGKRVKPGAQGPPPESRWTFLIATGVFAAVIGGLLHKVAHGGELPGRISIAPLMVAAVPFGAVAVALILAGIAGLPRALFFGRSGPRRVKRESREAAG